MARVRHFWSPSHARVVVGAALAVGVGAVLAPGFQAPAAAESPAVKLPEPQATPSFASQLQTFVPVSEKQDVLALDKPAAQASFPARVGVTTKRKKKRPGSRLILPSGWHTPVRTYSFSAVFAQPGGWSSGYHTGLDFVADSGSELYAPTDAVVIGAGYEGAYGNLLRIRVRKGLEVWYAHLSEIRVALGQKLRRGDVVGWIGMTGNTSGPHLHLEVRVKGQPKDPRTFYWPRVAGRELPAGVFIPPE